MSLFVEWNALLLCEYFSPASSNEDVWIHTSRRELDSFGLHLGGVDGLVDAVKRGAPWLNPAPANCAEAALQLARQRRSNLRAGAYVDPGTDIVAYSGAKAPTYLPILALWVLASSEAAEGFYARVGALLEHPFPNTPQLTNAMSLVWEDLEQWATVECGGRFGAFRLRVLGEHRFVGMPRSQCLVSHKDLEGVRQLFQICGLRPRQALTSSIFARLTDLGRDAHYLSSGLRSAFAGTVYHEPLKHILGRLLESWDGRHSQRRNDRQLQRSGGLAEPETDDSATLTLAPSSDEADGWEIQWRFSGSGQGNACFLVVDGVRIPARLEAWGDSFTTLGGESHQETCRTILAKSGTSEIELTVEYGDEDAQELGGGVRTGRIERRALRILVWDVPDPRSGEKLVERELPIRGPMYLVCSSSNRDNLERYLRNEGIDCPMLPPRGLPTGWTLTCIPHAERLTSEQRLWLSEGDADLGAAARVRFVGGRRILRGGSRLYASYDLPTVEVEAPSSATLEEAGMRFEEVRSQASPSKLSAIRRFRIQAWEQSRLVFELKVVDRNVTLASAKLRISAPEGTSVGLVRDFSMDSFGRSRHDERGLRGAGVGNAEVRREGSMACRPIRLDGLKRHDVNGTQPYETISGRFLDSLAQLGSIGYGAARDQLERLAELARTGIQPALLLLDLRSRAHLEIQTDDKGHMVRIHAVPPTLYPLPAVYDGLQLFGVGGSLRTQHWINLLGHADCIPFSETRTDGRLPGLRLAALSEDVIQEVAQSYEFNVAPLPCDLISRWASSLEHAKAELYSWGWGSLAADLCQLQRLQANSAQFRNVLAGRMVVDPLTRCQLFRFDDPSVPGLQVYVLGTIEADGLTRYSFIHDSRWGAWMSEVAFAAMLRERLSRQDVSPWPIHYDDDARDLWLPARIKPPFVIERALTLCSGCGPQEVSVVGTSDEDHTWLTKSSKCRTAIGGVSLVYDAFAPGMWLRYEWVPPEVASRVASLLGGEIKPLVSVKAWRASQSGPDGFAAEGVHDGQG